jgi:hypothetical protein
MEFFSTPNAGFQEPCDDLKKCQIFLFSFNPKGPQNSGKLPASLILSPEICDPGGIRPGVPPPELGDLASSLPRP